MMRSQQKITMSCTMLKGMNKEGILTPDADGYYTVVLGAYGTANSMGMTYDTNSVLPFFKPGSPLMRMIGKGVLRGEYKHPEQDMRIQDKKARYEAWISRIRQIDSDRVSHHIRNVRMEAGHKDASGRPMQLVIGEVRPSGPYGKHLKDALDNPHENVYFSVRSLTLDNMMMQTKYTRELVTWDFVNEGGIIDANKYNSPALESYSEVEVTPNMLWNLAEEQQQQRAVGMESNGVDYGTLARELGWHKEVMPMRETPNFMNW